MKKIFYSLLIFILFSTLNVYAKNIKIVQISDVNYAVTAEEEPKSEIADKLNTFIDKMNSSDADAIVFSGDMVAKSKKEDIESFAQTIKRLKKPYYIALGENDVHKNSGIAKEDFMSYMNYHNKHLKTNESNYTVKLSGKVTMLILDGAPPVVKNTHGYYSEKTLSWLSKTLLKNRKKGIVIFQHFPIMALENNYKYETLDAHKFRNTARCFSNILFIASGHINKDVDFVDKNDVRHISTPAFSETGKYREFVINDKDFTVNTTVEEL